MVQDDTVLPCCISVEAPSIISAHIEQKISIGEIYMNVFVSGTFPSVIHDVTCAFQQEKKPDKCAQNIFIQRE